MLRFFRKVKLKLIEEKHLQRYLIYAIGEIFLVMIGILLALQVNNWNQNRKEITLEQKYLESYIDDLRWDTTYLKRKIIIENIRQDSLTKFMSLLQEEQVSKLDLLKLMRTANWDAEYLILKDYTFKEITNSGKLGWFRSEKIKEGISDYYKTYDFNSAHINEMTGSGLKLLLEVFPELSSYYNHNFHEEKYKFDKRYWNWLNDQTDRRFKLLETSASYYKNKSMTSEAYCESLLRKANELLEIISNESNL